MGRKPQLSVGLPIHWWRDSVLPQSRSGWTRSGDALRACRSRQNQNGLVLDFLDKRDQIYSERTTHVTHY